MRKRERVRKGGGWEQCTLFSYKGGLVSWSITQQSSSKFRSLPVCVSENIRFSESVEGTHTLTTLNFLALTSGAHVAAEAHRPSYFNQ